MLSIVFEYNWLKINDLSDFNWDSFISLNDVWWFSWTDISVNTEKVVDTHSMIDFPWYMSWRIITLAWWVIWKDEEKMLSKVKELSRAFSVPSFYKNRLDWYHDLVFYRKWATDEEKFRISARVKKLPRFDKTLHLHRKRWFYLELFSEDPFFYSIQERSKIFDWVYNFTLPNFLPWSLIKSNTDIIENNWTAWAIAYFKITGWFRSIEIENKTTGQIFSLTWVNVEWNEFIEIIWKDWKVYKNWVYDIWNDLWNNIWLSSEWIFLAPWENEIEFRWSDYWDVIPTCEIKFFDTFNNLEI